MTTIKSSPTQSGIVVTTAITAGEGDPPKIVSNHVEGIAVTTGITAGEAIPPKIVTNHAEGIVACTSITAGGWHQQHAEGIVVSTAICPGGAAGTINHIEGLVLR